MPRLNLDWLKPPKVPADGVMSLGEHLREFRYRVVVSAITILVGMIGVAFFWQPLLDVLASPLLVAFQVLRETNPKLNMSLTMDNYVAPFFLVLRICLVGGLVVTSPMWLYQAWAYIVPALLAKEKKLALAFIAVATPLFLFGCAVAYWVMPQGIIVMLQFTPDNLGILNLLNVGNYVDLLLQLMVVFGLGFLVPVFVVGLNLIGLLSAAMLKKARVGVVFGTFVFGAAATPGTDPFSMLALAVPMMLLFFAAEAICHVNDKRRAKRLAEAEAADAAETAARRGLPAIQG